MPGGAASYAWPALAQDLGIVPGDPGKPRGAVCGRGRRANRMGVLGAAGGNPVRESPGHVLRNCRQEAGSGLRQAVRRASDNSARALLFIRGVFDSADGGKLSKEGLGPTFRLHTFFRSIEGLYAPVLKNVPAGRIAKVGPLSIEREPFTAPDETGTKLRQFELLYCEACGELFFGGLKAAKTGHGYITELLPHEPELDGLPDRASSQRFEEQTAQTYGLFWPVDREPFPVSEIRDNPKLANWRVACLERATGGVRPVGGPREPTRAEVEASPELVIGRFYERLPRKDKHGRNQDGKETHVPYACPACGTSYKDRKLPYRLSTIRNFRAGFAKTTQLLSTELFESQRGSSAKSPKLVSFSDSRQDAAQNALSIERFHHQDVRREVLVDALRGAKPTPKEVADLERKLRETEAGLAILKEAGYDEIRKVAEKGPGRPIGTDIASEGSRRLPVRGARTPIACLLGWWRTRSFIHRRACRCGDTPVR